MKRSDRIAATVAAQAHDAGRRRTPSTELLSADPCDVSGCAFIEIAGPTDPTLVRQLDLQQLGTSGERVLYRGPGAPCLWHHTGTRSHPGISGLGLRVEDAPALLAHLERFGARRLPVAPDTGLNVNIPAFYGPGGLALYLVDAFGEELMLRSDFAVPASGGPSRSRPAGLILALAPGQALYWAHWLANTMGFQCTTLDNELTAATGGLGYWLSCPAATFELILLEPRLPAGIWLQRHLERSGPGACLLRHAAAATQFSLGHCTPDLLLLQAPWSDRMPNDPVWRDALARLPALVGQATAPRPGDRSSENGGNAAN